MQRGKGEKLHKKGRQKNGGLGEGEGITWLSLSKSGLGEKPYVGFGDPKAEICVLLYRMTTGNAVYLSEIPYPG